MDTFAVMDAILTEALGITHQNLDQNNPVGRLVYRLTYEYADHRAQAQHHALRAADEFQRIADTPVTEQVYQARGHAEKYHEAVTALRALNTPLGTAFTAYKKTHPTAERPEKVDH